MVKEWFDEVGEKVRIERLRLFEWGEKEIWRGQVNEPKIEVWEI